MNDLGQSLALTQQNEFARGSISRVDLDIALAPTRRTASIKSLFADRNRLKAGETVRVSAVLEPTGEPDKTITKVFSFKVPADAPTGTMRIVATPGSGYWAGQIRVGAAPPDPANLKELVAAWNKVGAVNALTVQASTPDTYLLIDRKKISNPSPSQLKLLGAQATSSTSTFNETQTRSEETSYALSGVQVLTLAVESRRDADKSANAETAATGAPVAPKAGEIAPEVKVIESGANSVEEPDGDIGEAAQFSNKSQFLQQLKQFKGVRSNSTVLPSTPMQTAPSRAPIDRPIAGNAPSATPTPKPTPTPTPLPTPTVAPVEDPKAPARPALRWVQSSAAFFARSL